MTVAIPPELEAYADEPVNAEELRAKITVGLKQADGGELEDWDPQAIWAEVKKRHSELGRLKAD